MRSRGGGYYNSNTANRLGRPVEDFFDDYTVIRINADPVLPAIVAFHGIIILAERFQADDLATGLSLERKYRLQVFPDLCLVILRKSC